MSGGEKDWESDHQFLENEVVGVVDLDITGAKHVPEVVNSLPAINMSKGRLKKIINVNNGTIADPARGNDPPGHTPADSANVDVFHGELNANRKRKSKAQPSTWKREVNKKLRMTGKAYDGFQTSTTTVGKKLMKKQTQNKVRGAKRLGARCYSKLCDTSVRRSCDKISEQDRKLLFQQYWEKMDWKQRQVYVGTLVDRVKKSANTVKGKTSRRKETYKYYLKIGTDRLQICKFMFMSTFAITKRQISRWIKNSVSGIPTPPAPSKKLPKRPPGNQTFLKNFLAGLPKMPSHYCRKETRRLYLEPIYTSVTELFNIYKSNCAQNEQIPVSRWKFDLTLEEMSIAIFLPKKDQCDICCGHELGNIPDLEWNNHIKKKDRARDMKTADKVDAKSGNCYVITMDVESVKMCPYLKASAIYYKRKLAVHNFTVYNLGNNDVTCYWWNETEGSLVASSFASCVVDYLSEKCTEDKPIVIFSDGCTSQNRNAIMSNALLSFSINTGKTVTQKFLEKGHTQMECDSVHSAMETKLRNRTINLPGDYANICTEARTKPGPYDVKYLPFDFFKDYSEPTLTRYSSIRPGKKTGDPTVMDLRVIKYVPEGKIYYKLNFDDDWRELPRHPKPVHSATFPSLNSGRLKISKEKYDDLQELKAILPKHCHAYYDELPH